MSTNSLTAAQVFDLLQGNWNGEGRGEFPGVTSFAYRERLTFTRHDPKTVAYEQRTQKCYDGTTEYVESHWENGFLRILESGELEMTSAQIGRTEVLTGHIEVLGTLIRIRLVSKAIANDPRLISSARAFELEGDTLRYEMEMHTTKVEQSTSHVEITLQRGT
jgi:THAP domain-containing protein 4